MRKDHPDYDRHLHNLMRMLNAELPGPINAFGQLSDQVIADGALSARVKQLMALSTAIVARCDGCVAHHVHEAVDQGATRAELLESIGVAVLMGGAPALVYGAEALEAVEQFATDIEPEGARAADSDR